MPVADALAAVLAGAEPLPEEMVALAAAHHRVLARDVAALRTQPPQAMSAMDGYAVRAADASAVAARLKVIGEGAARPPSEKAVGAGEAVRIFPGGVIPDGADAVVIQEDTVVESGGITITEAALAGRPIRPAGRDFRKGAGLLAKGSPPPRPRSRAGRGHELSRASRAPPAEGRNPRNRRRTGDAGFDPRPRPDR